MATESVMPKAWVHLKSDLKNIRAIQKRFGTRKIRSFPTIGCWQQLYYQKTGLLKPVCLLDYLPYNKDAAMKTLEDELGWKYYGGKHYESTFTKFYQAYVLPVKFGVDKRRAHFSSLICSGQMTRSAAMAALEQELYPEDELRRDRDYVLKKLGLTEREFTDIMNLPVQSHLAYPSSQPAYEFLERAFRRFKPR